MVKPKIDYRSLTYKQMADIVQDIRIEIKERNSIGINTYTPYLDAAIGSLIEISEGEKGNFTSECGPREPKGNKSATSPDSPSPRPSRKKIPKVR